MMIWFLSIITSIISGIISGIIANWFYDRRLKRFLNKIEKGFIKIKNFPDEQHRKALLKAYINGEIPKVIDPNKEFELKPDFIKDIRNNYTTSNPSNESKIWKLKEFLKNFLEFFKNCFRLLFKQ